MLLEEPVGDLGIAVGGESGADGVERHAGCPQPGDQAGAGHLVGRVPAVAGPGVDPRRLEDTVQPSSPPALSTEPAW